MTDLSKLKATLTEIGCEFEEITARVEHKQNTYKTKYNGEAEWDIKIQLDSGIGYYSFICEFYFLKGKFKKHGVWE